MRLWGFFLIMILLWLFLPFFGFIVRTVVVVPEYQEQRHGNYDSKNSVKHTANIVIFNETSSHLLRSWRINVSLPANYGILIFIAIAAQASASARA